ncbi:hypothetical protein COBT_000547 [Conglomerata obtusa]
MNEAMIQNLADALFIFSPCIGYIPQLISGNIVFSPLLSLMLILSSFLKFFYYQVEQFSSIILAQSGFLIVVQLILIYNFKSAFGIVEERFYRSMERSIKRYGIFAVNCSIILAGLIAIHAMSFVGGSFYLLCGYTSATIETLVGVMQIFMKRMDKKYSIGENAVKRRLPKELFVCWIVGDIAKLYWMFQKISPLIFTIPIFIQIIVDFILIFE